MKNFRFFVATMSMLLLMNGALTAQVTIGDTSPPKSFSILELISKEGGLRLPQMTTAERDALITTADVADLAFAGGLMIYNTDEDCVDYYDKEKKVWISLCQGSSNPVVGISDCSRIRVYGQYYQGAPLGSANYISIPITVTQKGNYNIIASSGNGYYFQASGVFEELGTFEIRLNGMGTPVANTPNPGNYNLITFTCNGSALGENCTDVKVKVDAQTMGYRVECDSIKVFGSYQTRNFMTNDNYVEIPIDVVQTGPTNIQTEMVNGIKFSVSTTLTAFGEQKIVMKAEGSPKQEGTFTYSFSTDGSIRNSCSFKVSVFSTLGTFGDPACNCLAIYDERPNVDDGEYWLQDCKAMGDVVSIRTYCDIKGGGWTLVWSYSESTARSTYTPTGTMTMTPATYSIFNSQPFNRITTQPAGADGPTDYLINYYNFRLNKNDWQHLAAGDKSLMKVRICENPTDMNDEWGINNYGIISPRNIADNPLQSEFAARRNVPAEGKLFGKQWKVLATGGGYYGGWDEISGNHPYIAIYNNATYTTHWDWGFGGSTTLFQVVPNKGGANNEMRISEMNNMFGWYGEDQPNHHFGKCGTSTTVASGDEFSFTTKRCTNTLLWPHTTFNGGQGRICQWFVR